MSRDLEEHLTRTLALVAEDAPVPGYDPVDAVRGRQRRRRRRRATIAAACVVLVAAVGVVAGVRQAVPRPAPGSDYAFAPDRIPDFTKLPDPEKLWPEAVHRLPVTLPDGSRYAVIAVLGDDRYLVARDWPSGETAPSIFDTRAGTVTAVGTSAVSDGLANSRLMMAREADGRAVWLVVGARNNRYVRELWVAPLDGGAATRLATLTDGSSPRFGVAGEKIFWEYEQRAKGRVDRVIRSVSVHGGAVVDVPGSAGFQSASVSPWITDQYMSTASIHRQGKLLNVLTGERLAWTANNRIQFVRCGPTWCTGRGSADRVALQDLDGTNPVELPWTGEIAPAVGGRFAIGQLELPASTLHLIWDRTTGEAAGVTVPRNEETPRAYGWNIQLSDFEPGVLSFRADDHDRFVLDLRAIG